MPAVFLDRLPLPSLQAYTVISVLLLSGSVYYAVQVTSQLEWKINAAVNLDLSTDIDTTMTVGNLTFVSGHQLTLEQFLLEHHHYIRRLLEVMYFMFQEPLCVWAREQLYWRLEPSLQHLHALNQDSTTYLEILQSVGPELDRVPNGNDTTGLMLSLEATAAARRPRGRQIRVQPTSLARHRPGLVRGPKRVPTGCPPSDQPVKRPRKRPHSLQRNVQDNAPSVRLH